MICYADIIPTDASDKDVITVFNSYVGITALIMTSDKDLYQKLFGLSLLVKAKKGSDPVRIVKAENTEFQGYNWTL
jgi:hypothetical protein